MAFVASCDICKSTILDMDEVTRLDDSLIIPGIAEITCASCAKQIKRAVRSHTRYYARLLSDDVRELIFEMIKR